MPDLEIAGRELIADWIETRLLIHDTHALNLGALRSLAESELGINAVMLDVALSAIEHRARVLGASYPFEIHPVAVKMRPNAESTAYVSLLLLAPGGVARQLVAPNPTPAMALMFEQIACRALERFLGPHSRAIRFGWPSDIGRPAEFPDAIHWLCGLMGIPPGSSYRPPRRKDGGVDVVAWRPFPDHRSGFPVMLVQCTLQHELLSKSSDVDTRIWAGWLTLDTDPMTVLAVPGTIPPNEMWNELAARNLILERLRLAGLLGPEHDDIQGMAEMNLVLLDEIRKHYA